MRIARLPGAASAHDACSDVSAVGNVAFLVAEVVTVGVGAVVAVGVAIAQQGRPMTPAVMSQARTYYGEYAPYESLAFSRSPRSFRSSTAWTGRGCRGKSSSWENYRSYPRSRECS